MKKLALLFLTALLTVPLWAQNGTINVRVWDERGTNGLRNSPTDKPIDNVTIYLLDNTSAVVATATSDANGEASFSSLVAGDYQIEVYPPTDHGIHGKTWPITNIGRHHVDPNTGRTPTITLTGSDSKTIGAALMSPGIVLARVWREKAPGNGIRNSGTDPWVYGMEAGLLEADGVTPVIDPNTGQPVGGIIPCGSDGLEMWAPADRPVVIRYIGNGATFVKYLGGNNFSRNSRNPATGLTDPIQLTQGNQTFGGAPTGVTDLGPNILAGSIKVRVWDERGTNGLRNFPTDKPISGVTINLLDCESNVVATTSDANGEATFSGLAEGDYQVEVIPPAHHGIHAKTWPITQSGRHHVDSNTGLTPIISLTGGSSRTIGAALKSPGIVLARVWQEKAPGNGIRNSGTDPWVYGMEAELLEIGGNPVIDPNTGQAVKGIIPCGSSGFEMWAPADRPVVIRYIPNGATFAKYIGGNNFSRNSRNPATGLTDPIQLT